MGGGGVQAILAERLERQVWTALLRLAGVEKVHWRKDAEPARFDHRNGAKVQVLGYANRSLRHNVERLEHSQSAVGNPASYS